jgi:hypothetical protein
MDMIAEKLQVFVPKHSSGEKLQFQKNLEAVANTQHKPSLMREFLEFFHKRGELGYGSRTQVISVRKSSWHDDTIGIVQVMIFVPEIKGVLATNFPEDMECVMVTIGTGENDNSESQLIQ